MAGAQASAGVRAAVHVRPVTDADMPAIQAIYAHHVLNGISSFEEIAPDLEEMRQRRAKVLAAGLPYLVAEREGAVAGYAYAGFYHARSAYRHTLEDSVYVADDLRGGGIGSALLARLLEECEKGPWRQMIAIIGNSGNAGSIALHARAGFTMVGTLQSVGLKFGRWLDVVVMQRALGPGADTMPGAE